MIPDLQLMNKRRWDSRVSLETTGWWGGMDRGSIIMKHLHRAFFGIQKNSKLPASNGKCQYQLLLLWSRNTPASSLAERNGNNGRLYHVRILLLSDYTLGRPWLIEDEHNPGLMVTDKGADNKNWYLPLYDCISIRFC